MWLHVLHTMHLHVQSEEVIRLLQCMGEMLGAYPAQLDPGLVPRMVGFWEQLFVWLHACR
jgi:hypothetical protein